jgi:MEMO1 family protein
MKFEFLPKIREDVTVQVLKYEDEKMLLLSDPSLIAEDDIMIPTGFYPLFSFLNGNIKYEDFKNEILKNSNDGERLLLAVEKLIDDLDEYCYLLTDNYFEKKNDIDQYLMLDVRPPILSGFSYSEDKQAYIESIDSILNAYNYIPETKQAEAIIAPHIDFTVGDSAINAYSAIYQTIENTDAETFIIFGTSHYTDTSPFMLTRKNYSTPEGLIPTDNELLDLLSHKIDISKYTNEMAHRNEHSIEFQACLLQRKFSGKNIKILPILAGSIQEYFLQNKSPEVEAEYSGFIRALKESINDLGRKVCFIASGDFAHIGARHNSQIVDAMNSLSELEKEDKVIFDIIGKNNKPEFIRHFFGNKDIWQVCGAAAFYALMQMCQYSNYQCVYYGIWNEHEINAAVSFSSICLY